MEKSVFREILLEQQEGRPLEDPALVAREELKAVRPLVSIPHAVVISGIRRCGKSTLLHQIQRRYYKEGEYYTLNFEDERFLDFHAIEFNALYEVLIELFGERKVFFLDEVQVVEQWESFVRRMMDRGCKFYLTGSNASLLSREVGTKLTGRRQGIELYPFSFREYLEFHGVRANRNALLLASQRGKLARHFQAYLKEGGMPEHVRFQRKEILRAIYDDILYRDVVIRYRLSDTKTLRELALYLLSNAERKISFNRLKDHFRLGSVNTVKRYIGFLEDCYLVFAVSKFSHSVKTQQIAPKKVYPVDNGFTHSIAFGFSANEGWALESLVAQELKRRRQEMFYYETRKGREVDFLVRTGSRVSGLLQVTRSLADEESRDRESKALAEAMEELGIKEGWILALEAQESEISFGRRNVRVLPILKWFLER